MWKAAYSNPTAEVCADVLGSRVEHVFYKVAREMPLVERSNFSKRIQSCKKLPSSGFVHLRDRFVEKPVSTMRRWELRACKSHGTCLMDYRARDVPLFDVHEAVSRVVSLAYAHSCIIIADACGEEVLLSRHGLQRPHSITC